MKFFRYRHLDDQRSCSWGALRRNTCQLDAVLASRVSRRLPQHLHRKRISENRRRPRLSAESVAMTRDL